MVYWYLSKRELLESTWKYYRLQKGGSVWGYNGTVVQGYNDHGVPKLL